MSAGGLSYHGIIGYKSNVTLPSVDGFGGTLNILRDPPKMIMTRKRDKVGETSSITQMQQESGDRACEAINVYARGVNPFVSVSYQNYGNNGGQRVNGFSNKRGGNGGQQAKKPYRLGPDGAFRPPIQPPQNLLPLSRLPRLTTSSFTQPGFADFSKKALCPQKGDLTKGVRKNKSMLRTCVRPTATYQIETPIRENFEVKYVIKNPTHITGHSGVRTMDLTQQHVGVPVKTVVEDPLHANANANPSSALHYVDSNHMNPERFLQDTLHSSVESNLYQNVQLIPIDELVNVDVRTKDQFNISHTAGFKGHEKYEYIHEDPRLHRPLPVYSSQTNQSRPDRYINPTSGSYQRERSRNRPNAYGYTNVASTRKNTDTISSRSYRLKPTITPGGMSGKATGIPGQMINSSIPQRETLRQSMNRKVMDMRMGRN